MWCPGNCQQNIRQMGPLASVEQSWKVDSDHVVPPQNLTGHSGFLLFNEGIKPMWEDDANRSGGRWVICLWKALASCCLAVLR
ncbi:unnamed protein product [Nyctereutes procyonoides]|uniref:(raccoon dog) hypothetical protein n=1 Tax=Nyctereutes procyonoides TaxID=34880 RepID=A0A811ZMM8_NYCPR|nr:unnamed protein product [Nyctereutes procyonoides]